MSRLRKYIGDREFYRTMFRIAVPMVIQSGITTFVNLLDNVMVGRLGTLPMSAVTIDNEFIFVFNLMIFGGMAGAGIFTAQFFGKQDTNGVRNTFRFKFLLGLVVSGGCIALFLLLQDPLIHLFTDSDKNSAEEIAVTVGHAKDYLQIIVIGLIPFSLAQVYASTMREVRKTTPPMVASILAIFTNLVLNYVLIFGKFGAPALGVRGAAIATVAS
ncbi:MAG: polysaccharide biosynthesis C-terminal domain-containing protein, partial [Clostridia bacterium]|nr:polysaccharide biosynthesis C-terminal domain-containing protein [Clostridia bacterium]